MFLKVLPDTAEFLCPPGTFFLEFQLTRSTSSRALPRSHGSCGGCFVEQTLCRREPTHFQLSSSPRWRSGGTISDRGAQIREHDRWAPAWRTTISVWGVGVWLGSLKHFEYEVTLSWCFTFSLCHGFAITWRSLWSEVLHSRRPLGVGFMSSSVHRRRAWHCTRTASFIRKVLRAWNELGSVILNLGYTLKSSGDILTIWTQALLKSESQGWRVPLYWEFLKLLGWF